jgi:Domain of unknown function (DUF4350)
LKERLVTVGLALGALFLCYALFVPKPHSGEAAPPRPLSTELAPSGYQAAWRWLAAQHIPVVALHEHFDRLNRAGITESLVGNVLLTTLPHELPVRADEAMQLDAWIERGNTLVVAAALDDTPAWALTGGGRLANDVGRLTRLKFEAIGSQAKDSNSSRSKRALQSALSAFEPRDLEIEPVGAHASMEGVHALMDGVHALRVASDLPASRWRAVPMDSTAVLKIAQVANNGEAAVWIKRQGRGQVITLAVAGLFSNRDIGSADNAKLFSNILGWSFSPGSAVIFDDAHQGAVNYYDAKAFYADPRLHRTIGWLVLLWLVFVLGIQRLGAHVNHWRPADVTAFVSTSGDFFAATLTPAAAAGRMLTNFFNSVRRRLGANEDGTPMWEWLSSQATVPPSDVAELRLLQAHIQSGRGFNLIRLQNLLSRLQGKII